MKIKLACVFIDIWRTRNRNKRKFIITWLATKYTPYLASLGLLSDGPQDFIQESDIIPSIKSNHPAIPLQFNSFENKPRHPLHLILNSSLVNDENFLNLIKLPLVTRIGKLN